MTAIELIQAHIDRYHDNAEVRGILTSILDVAVAEAQETKQLRASNARLMAQLERVVAQ